MRFHWPESVDDPVLTIRIVLRNRLITYGISHPRRVVQGLKGSCFWVSTKKRLLIILHFCMLRYETELLMSPERYLDITWRRGVDKAPFYSGVIYARV